MIGPQGFTRYDLDPKSPFTFLIERPEGRSILIQGGLLYLLFFLVVPLFMIAGYPIALARALVRGTPIPSVWSISHALDGLKVIGVFLVYAAPFLLTVILSFAVSATNNGGAEILGGGMFFAAMTFGQVYMLALTALQPAFIAILAATGKMSDCFRPQMLKQVIRSFGWGYLAAFGLIYAASLIGMVGLIACFIGMFWTMFYVATVQGHIGAQLARPLIQEHAPEQGMLGHT